jgi:ATP-dependent protease ClpP protease subunit
VNSHVLYADADFTPNPDRAIWIEGKFTEALLDLLRPRIAEHTATNRDPITVFVNSGGGSPDVAEAILNLLRWTSQDDPRASRIITVVRSSSEALSMAANFLAAGDYAIAAPDCTLLWHGGRWPLADMVSVGEAGKLYARTLPTFHERNAAKLARASVHRFLRIVSAYRESFAQHRADVGDPALGDVECFQAILHGKLSPAGQKVLDRAGSLFESSNGLLLLFLKKVRRGRTVTKEYLQELMLRVSMAWEYQSNKGAPAWDGGLSRISDHFYFLNAYFDFAVLRDWIAARAEPQPAGTDVEEDYFRLFFLALCRALQEGENYITALDALWLGLIDTVRRDLPRDESH